MVSALQKIGPATLMPIRTFFLVLRHYEMDLINRFAVFVDILNKKCPRRDHLCYFMISTDAMGATFYMHYYTVIPGSDLLPM